MPMFDKQNIYNEIALLLSFNAGFVARKKVHATAFLIRARTDRRGNDIDKKINPWFAHEPLNLRQYKFRQNEPV